MSPKNLSFAVDSGNTFGCQVENFAIVEKIVIDDFESGRDPDNFWGYVNDAEKNDTDLISPGLDGTSNRWRHKDFVNVHLTGSNAVDRGPQQGDVFEVWFRIETITGSPVINRFEFGATGVDDSDMYRVEFEANTSEPEFQFEDTSGEHLVTDAGVEFREGQTYSIRIEWKAGNDQVTAQAFEEPGHNPFSQKLSFLEPGGYTAPGINLFTDANNVCSWDEIRILP